MSEKKELFANRKIVKKNSHPMSTESKKQLWAEILRIAVTILTALATALGTHSCIAMDA